MAEQDTVAEIVEMVEGTLIEIGHGFAHQADELEAVAETCLRSGDKEQAIYAMGCVAALRAAARGFRRREVIE